MSLLLDSNIIIYSCSEEYHYLRGLITDQSASISEISRVEILGYHMLKPIEEVYFNDIFNLINIIVPSKEIFDKAIEIRKLYNLKLGDSIIASTALVGDLTLYTRNVADFKRIAGLKLINPVK